MTTEGKFSMTKELLKLLSIKSVLDWLDDDYTPSEAKLVERNWSVIPVPDSINAMEAEWMAEAILQTGAEEAVGVSFEFGQKERVEKLNVDRDSLLRYIGTHSHEYVLITSTDLDFLYYKDDANRYFLLCGDSAFLKQAYKCTFDTAKMMYFDFWVESDFNSETEKEILKQVWTKYTNLNTRQEILENNVADTHELD